VERQAIGASRDRAHTLPVEITFPRAHLTVMPRGILTYLYAVTKIFMGEADLIKLRVRTNSARVRGVAFALPWNKARPVSSLM
jgi:hypothetical protein